MLLFKIRHFLSKYFIIILSIILILASISYYIFFREIRDFNFSGDSIYENNDLVFDFDLRSKSEIKSINLSLNYDLEIKNDFEYLDEYNNYLSEKSLSYNFYCNTDYTCKWNISLNKSFEDLKDSIKNYKKEDVFWQILLQREQEQAQQLDETLWQQNNISVNEDWDQIETQNQDDFFSSLDPNISPEEYQEKLNNEWLSSNNPNSAWLWINNSDSSSLATITDDDFISSIIDDWNNLLDDELNINDTTITEFTDDQDQLSLVDDENILEVDCSDEQFKYDFNCYKTPDLDISFNAITIDYEIIFENWKTENYSKTINKQESIFIPWDK